MELKKIFVNGYKSLVELEIVEPNSFSVFAGPNGSGKSNIFEALEFTAYDYELNTETVESLFGGKDKIINFNSQHSFYSIQIHFETFISSVSYDKGNSADSGTHTKSLFDKLENNSEGLEKRLKSEIIPFRKKFFINATRLFINKDELNRIKVIDNKRLLPDASNLSSIIKNILSDSTKNQEFIEWLQLFIPGFENIEVQSDIDGNDRFHLFEKGTKKPFDKKLISDGTYNILALLTAVYQSNEPQFLCIEEPENGLNPYVIKTLVDFFRKQCEEKGHYIWLNTHSQTLVKELQPEELILVDKVDGATQIKQFPKDYNLHGLTMDEAWLSNALGGGLPW